MTSVSASILLPVSIAEAFRVITDLKTIIRLSPFFSLKHIEPSLGESAQKGNCYKLTIEYYATKMTEILDVEIEELERDRLISYTIGSPVLRTIRYDLAPSGEGVRITQTFKLDSDNETIIDGTQSELDAWINSIGNYLKLCGSGSPLKSAWKWFMDRVWLKLSLSERNIALIMVKISVLELALLLILVLIWNIGVLG